MRGSSAAELLSTVRENPASLEMDPTKDIRTFRVASTGSLGSRRGRGRGAFIDSVLSSVDDDTVPVALASTDYSSQDGIEPASQEEPTAAQAAVRADDSPDEKEVDADHGLAHRPVLDGLVSATSGPRDVLGNEDA